MKRNFLFDWYESPRGKLLKALEIDYIKRSITVSCKQTILQIGGLGWENEFVDCSFYKYYTILDAKCLGFSEALKIQAKSHSLPIQTASVDMIILPHMLEFDAHRFQTVREVERVLKPEGIVVILNFNPWSLSVRYQYLWNKTLADSWNGHFISKSRIIDWLKVLNFEVTVASEFQFSSVKSAYGKFAAKSHAFSAAAYAVKAIKRRYNPIPLTPVLELKPKLVLANSINRLNHSND
ncbi:MAG: methyltransferase type 11 [Methylobacter sp.]|nr:MAG: methyltransferase type 11 [Methylobacter sp.]PPD04600.1 MAG: methyltransferase type 11 [Methylobacter sp.]PPD24508.1 MAG: methyltransferase type 11 [Methylobacter sp.]